MDGCHFWESPGIAAWTGSDSRGWDGMRWDSLRVRPARCLGSRVYDPVGRSLVCKRELIETPPNHLQLTSFLHPLNHPYKAHSQPRRAKRFTKLPYPSLALGRDPRRPSKSAPVRPIYRYPPITSQVFPPWRLPIQTPSTPSTCSWTSSSQTTSSSVYPPSDDCRPLPSPSVRNARGTS